MARPKQVSLFPGTEAEPLAVEDRRTDEIVVGFVGPIGSGISFSAEILAQLLKSKFAYEGRTIKISTIINECSYLLKEEAVSATDEKRTEKLQNLGTKLREKFGHRYLVDKTISDINLQRGLRDGPPSARRYFTIIDSIKHPDEVSRLREVYGDTFWLIGVFAPDEIRKRRLFVKGLTENYVVDITTRDEDEGVRAGQRVRDAMFLADFFIRNDGENDIRLKTTMDRFLEIIFGIGVQTPSHDESAMYAAASAAAGSACLSRQVGAVIATKEGEIIGIGNNDVPKFQGGLYSMEDKAADHRCHLWRNKICHNDARKEEIFQGIIRILRADGIIDDRKKQKTLQALQKSDIRNLIEFSRAVHAEMEAIIAVGRNGKSGLRGSTLYSTTFPCHNCARHIVASGIHRVIYIEPYTKSLAINLHEDAISISESDIGSKVVFLQYEGVAPKNMIRMFKDRGPRKQAGKILLTKPSEAQPVSIAPLDGFQIREELVVAHVRKIESSSSVGH
jgi:deoxycytidylate deaminase